MEMSRRVGVWRCVHVHRLLRGYLIGEVIGGWEHDEAVVGSSIGRRDLWCVYAHRRKEMVLMSTHFVMNKTLMLLLSAIPLLPATSRSGSGFAVFTPSSSPASLLLWCLHLVGSWFCLVLGLLLASKSLLWVSGRRGSVCSVLCWISTAVCLVVCWFVSALGDVLLCVLLSGFAGCWEAPWVVGREVRLAAAEFSSATAMWVNPDPFGVE
jgi:hypothetical protein